MKHPLTDIGIRKFLKDWGKVPKIKVRLRSAEKFLLSQSTP
jgi:hypothetical protein